MSKAEQRPDPAATTAERPAEETTAGLLTFQSWHEGSSDDMLPVRYDVREGENGRYLRCKEAPGVGVAIDRSYAFTEAEARKLGERVILLDGAGQFGPLVDNARQLYNLDHHDDCLRVFTLATCEQALVLVLKGLELDRGDWRILANEPDLDTVFAIWVLLNHRRLRNLSPRARDAIAPLLRLEGAIDANGYEIAEFCGLPHDLLLATKAKLDQLFAVEQALKKSGEWGDVDPIDYTRDRLVEIDYLVYERSDFDDFTTVEEEYGHVDISDGRVAVVCRDSEGIYEVERRLKKVWGDRLGIIALAKEPGHYTLRRAASLSNIDLRSAYDWLNQLDPNVDGHPPEKRWGGSDDIGGSPRPDGTGLAPRDVAAALRRAYQPVRPKVLGLRLGLVGGLSGLLAALAVAAGLAYERFVGPPQEPPEMALQLSLVALVIAGGALLASRVLAAGRSWQLGWRWPAGEDWVLLLPPVLLGAAAGGVWLPREIGWEAEALAAAVAAMALSAAALGLWFQGLVHGLLLEHCRVQLLGGPWMISRPALASALLYAAATVGASILWLAPLPDFWRPFGELARWPITAAGAFAVGLTAAMIRERSLSLLPAIGAMIAGGVARLALELF
ncbi:MAG: hypothetical protein D6696_15665 [Acidobacteria bacterium]|nr:MAG: hypothetical protein D6696_15665 [Acidobacteriota bacterium]